MTWYMPGRSLRYLAPEHDQERYRRPDEQEPDALVERDVDGPEVYRDHPGVLSALPGVEDLLPYLLLGQLLSAPGFPSRSYPPSCS